MRTPSEKQFEGAWNGLQKEDAKRRLNSREQRDLAIVENYFRDRLRGAVLERFPSKSLREIWGYDRREGAQQYRAFCRNHAIPGLGQTINLAEVLRRFHAIATALFPPTAGRRRDGQPIGFSEFDGPVRAGSTGASERSQVADDSVANWKAKRERLKFEQECDRLVDVDSLKPKLTRVGGILRSGCDAIRSQFGPEAEAVMVRSIEDCERALMSLFDDDDDGDQEGAA